MHCVLQTLTQSWRINGRCEMSFFAPAGAKFLGFSIAADKEARSGSVQMRFNNQSLDLSLVEALYKKHMAMDGAAMPMQSPVETFELVAVLRDGEHPMFDLSNVERVGIGKKGVFIKINGPAGLTGIVTLLVETPKG